MMESRTTAVHAARHGHVYLSVAARTEMGPRRLVNEDSFIVDDLTRGLRLDDGETARFVLGDRGGLLAVSDGLGGENVGVVASTLVVETLRRNVTAEPACAEGDARADASLMGGLQCAHRAVWDAAYSTGRVSMRATVAAVFVHGKHAYVAEAGDSHSYLLRGGRIHRLIGGPPSIEAAPSLDSTTLGHRRAVEIALGRLEIRRSDCLVLCSDGVSSAVEEDEIRRIVLGAPRLDVAAARLVEQARANGSDDDATVVLAGVGGDLPWCELGGAGEPLLEIHATFEAVVPQ